MLHLLLLRMMMIQESAFEQVPGKILEHSENHCPDGSSGLRLLSILPVIPNPPSNPKACSRHSGLQQLLLGAQAMGSHRKGSRTANSSWNCMPSSPIEDGRGCTTSNWVLPFHLCTQIGQVSRASYTAVFTALSKGRWRCHLSFHALFVTFRLWAAAWRFIYFLTMI